MAINRPHLPEPRDVPIPATYVCVEPDCPEHLVAKTSDTTFDTMPRCGYCFNDCELAP